MQWGLAQINAASAWDVVTGTPGVVIAIIDSGIDTTHPDLSGQLWVNPGEISGNSVDDDNNGYVDDVNGWNFVAGTNTITDDEGHGTLVAGVAGATSNNGIGISGMCWQCRLMPVKVMNSGGVANYSDIAAGVAYAAAKGAQVINLSLGGYADSATLRAAIQAASATSIVVAGAGNDNVSTPFYPAAYPQAIAVAATDSADTKWSLSNYGSWISVAAPGVSITTTLSGGGYGANDGTSLAAPFVSGLAGLIKSQHPDWSPALVRAQIIHTTDAVTDTQLGSGRINAASAMQAARPLFAVSGYSINGTPNGRPNPSSGNALVISVYNDWLDATSVNGTLSTGDPFVTVVTSTASFGNIASGATQSSSTFSFTVASGAGYNHAIAFTLNLSANGGAYIATLPFTVTTRSSSENVGGLMTVDTIWTNDKTYIVNSDVTIVPSVTLTIQPGTAIRFNGFYRIDVRGQLIAIGTITNPIIFTSNVSPTRASWNGIGFKDSSVDAVVDANGNYINGSTVQYADLSYGGSVIADHSTPYIGHNHIHDGTPTNPAQVPGGQAMVMFDYPTTGYIVDNVIEGIVGGEGPIKISNGDGYIYKNVIRNNSGSSWGGALWCSDHSCQIIDNVIVNNTGPSFAGGPFFYSGNHTVRHNLIANNTSNSPAWSDRGGSAIGKWGATISVTQNTIVGNIGWTTFHLQYGSSADAIRENNIVGNQGDLDIFWNAAQNLAADGNYWGTTSTSVIDSRIYDHNDNFDLGTVLYQPMADQPIASAPAFLWQLSTNPASPIGIQQGTFTMTFSAPMDQSSNPVVTFGATQPYTSFVVLDNAQWISSTVWRATYDVTSLVSRGTYTFSVSGANGLDGMPIPTDTSYTFTVDYAGGVSANPPPAPTIVADFCRNSATSAAASWSIADPTITLYQYALGIAPNAIDVLNWTTTNGTSVVRTGLNLVTSQRYYFTVKARNSGGLWSPASSASFTAGVPCSKVYLPLMLKNH